MLPICCKLGKLKIYFLGGFNLSETEREEPMQPQGLSELGQVNVK